MPHDNRQSLLRESLRCDLCGSSNLEPRPDAFECTACQRTYRFDNGNFVYPVDLPGRFAYDAHWTRFAGHSGQAEKRKVVRRFVEFIEKTGQITSPVLDIGCGDGNLLASLPSTVTAIGVDLSYAALRVLSELYRGDPRFVFVCGDAQKLPLRDGIAPLVVSYGCCNVVSDVHKAVADLIRVTSRGGRFALWGWGTGNPVLLKLVRIARTIYRRLPPAAQSAFAASLIPAMAIVRNNSGVSPLRNSIEECREIVMTNLTPDHLTLFNSRSGDSWNRFFAQDTSYEKLGNFDSYCGEIYHR